MENLILCFKYDILYLNVRACFCGVQYGTCDFGFAFCFKCSGGNKNSEQTAQLTIFKGVPATTRPRGQTPTG